MTDETPAPSPARPPLTFREAFAYWLKLGFISFGGPAGQIALMHQELVERRRWISEGRFLHALNYCMLLPGPEAPDTGLPLEGDRSTGAACGFAFSAIPLGCASSSSSRSSTAGAGASSCRRTKSQSFRVIDLEVLN